MLQIDFGTLKPHIQYNLTTLDSILVQTRRDLGKTTLHWIPSVRMRRLKLRAKPSFHIVTCTSLLKLYVNVSTNVSAILANVRKLTSKDIGRM